MYEGQTPVSLVLRDATSHKSPSCMCCGQKVKNNSISFLQIHPNSEKKQILYYIYIIYIILYDKECEFPTNSTVLRSSASGSERSFRGYIELGLIDGFPAVETPSKKDWTVSG